MSAEDRLTLQLLLQKLRKRYNRMHGRWKLDDDGRDLHRELDKEIAALERLLA